MQKALFAYAESKGELASRRGEVTELYKGMNADIDSELTAELMGDYLFTDKDFVTHLTSDRNLFQKIYDEIKYLYKVATGKEQKEIAKVKKEFDKAWKELNVKPSESEQKNNTADKSGVGYSLLLKYTDGSVSEIVGREELTKEKITDYLYKAKKGELKRDSYVPVRKNTPKAIIDTLERYNWNIEDKLLIMQTKKIQQALSSVNKKARKKTW